MSVVPLHEPEYPYESFIRTYDDCLRDTECADVIQTFEKLSANGSAIQSHTQYDQNKARRDDMALMLEDHNPDMAGMIHQRMQSYLQEYVNDLPAMNQVTTEGYNVKLQRTMPSGGYHIFHAEADCRRSMARFLVWMIYLNDDFEGGTTEFLNQRVELTPKAGQLVIWPAFITHLHRGNPIREGAKYVATGWWYYAA